MIHGNPPNLDLLQYIEQIIVTAYRLHPDLPDYDVGDALAALIDDYRRDENHPPKEHRLNGHSRDVYDAVRIVCDWRLGREVVSDKPIDPPDKPINTPEEIVAGLRKIRKSVERWTKEGGRQGYLRFISSMIP